VGARPSLSLSGPVSALRGEHPPFSLAASLPGKRIARCHVHGPDGAFVPEYSRNLLLNDGPVSFVIPTALDDAVGPYAIECRDLLGGASARAVMELR
jgi:hypothetical protein